MIEGAPRIGGGSTTLSQIGTWGRDDTCRAMKIFFRTADLVIFEAVEIYNSCSCTRRHTSQLRRLHQKSPSGLLTITNLAAEMDWDLPHQPNLYLRLCARAIHLGLNVILIRTGVFGENISGFTCHPNEKNLLELAKHIETTYISLKEADFIAGSKKKRRQNRGRTALHIKYPIIASLVRQYYEGHGAYADPRLRQQGFFGSCATATLRGLTKNINEYLVSEGIPRVSRSSLYYLLQPRRCNTIASRRHHHAFTCSELGGIRPVRSSRDGRDTYHPDALYCTKKNEVIRKLIVDSPDHIALALSLDDKARVPVIGPVARPSAAWTIPDSDRNLRATSLPVHNFSQTKESSVVISTTLNLSLATRSNEHRKKKGQKLTYLGGSGYLHIKANTKSTSVHHICGMLRHFWKNGWSVPRTLCLFTDSGNDHEFRYNIGKLTYAFLFVLMGLESLIVCTYEPHGGSKKNPVENVHASINQHISGQSIVSIDEIAEISRRSVNLERPLEKQLDKDEMKELRERGAANLRQKLSDCTYSGLRLKAEVWQPRFDIFDARVVKEKLEKGIRLLKMRGDGGACRSNRQEVLIDVPSSAQALLRELGVKTPPAIIDPFRLYHLINCPKHTIRKRYHLVIAKCKEKKCELCCGLLSSESTLNPLISSALVDSIKGELPLNQLCPSIAVKHTIQKLVHRNGKLTKVLADELLQSNREFVADREVAKFLEYVAECYTAVTLGSSSCT